MAGTDPSLVTWWCNRHQSQGFVHVEVTVRKNDANLVRAVSTHLAILTAN